VSENGKVKPAVLLPPELVERLQAREGTYLTTKGRPSEVPVEPLRKAASRYFALIERELAALDLTEAEASLICEALNGTGVWDWGCLGSVTAGSALRLEVSDAIRLNGLDQEWEVDQDLFLAKIGRWPESTCLAVLDAVERFWADCETSTVRSVGLCRA
jgi:hypothetical protein